VHVKSLSAHAVRSLIIARKKLVGQRVTLENQIRGLAVVFGVRLPRALTAAFIDQALKASMLTRYKGQLKLKDWAFAVARRSTMRKARIALSRRLAIIMHAMLRDGTEFLAA
jgi:hypothetical protein